jgi:DNA-binding sugar fermentation-stimulating protein
MYTRVSFCGAFEISSICKPHTRLLLKRTSNKKRLVKYNIAFVYTPEGLVFSNPKYNRTLFKEAFDDKILQDFESYSDCTALSDNDDAKGIDFVLTNKSGKKCFVYVMSVYDKFDGRAVFPNNVDFFPI